jgi:hypothetical protein
MSRLLAVLLLLATTASAATQSDVVVVNMTRILAPESGTASPLVATVWNASREPLQVELVLRLHGNATITATSTATMNCASESEKVVRCRSTVPVPHDARIEVPASISPFAERRLAVIANVEWTRGGEQFTSEETFASGVFPRQIEVTNTGDEGPGSFRAALDYANANCADIPCEITFREGGRIILNTPLAPITAPDIIINGRDETILDGDALWFGSGLVFAGTGLFEVRDLQITRFPWDGIAVVREVPEGPFRSLIYSAVIDQNGSRGINMHAPANRVEVQRSTINSNGRSGVFMVGVRDVRLSTGTVADNGASGVFVSAESRQVELYRNVFRDNRHWGVTIGRGAELVEVSDNHIHGNGIAGIDVGIDGPDPFVYAPAAGIIGPPVLTSATRHPTTGQTTVTGIVPGATGTWDVTLWFSTQPGQGDGFIGHTTAVNGAFSLVLPDELQAGWYITATAVHELNGEKWSTEFSNNVQAP